MSGVCPTQPIEVSKTFTDPSPPGVDVKTQTGTPCALINSCECVGGSTSTVIVPGAPSAPGESVVVATSCCGVPGPPGPLGPTGLTGSCGEGITWSGDWATSTLYQVTNPPTVCSSDMIHHNGAAYICILDHTSDTVSEPGVGASWESYWDLVAQGAGGDMTWLGPWVDGFDYEEGDWITHEGNSYIVLTTHTSVEGTPPNPVDDYDMNGTNYLLYSTGEAPSMMSNLFDGVMDWIKDVPNWGLKNWLTALAVGGGLIWAGSKVNDMFNATPEGDGNAGSQYDGDPMYSGAFTPPNLQQAVSKLCDWAEVTSYDVSQLPTTEVNFTLGNIAAARNTLEMLSRVYFFDMVDSGGILKFVPKAGASSVKSLTIDQDFGFVSQGQQLPAPYSIKRYQGTDLPRSVALTYFSETTAHNEFVQTATLETFTEGQDVKLNVPVTLSEQQAYDIAETSLVNSHIERTTYAFTTTYKNIALEPGDIVTVDQLGELRILRIEEQQEGGLLNIICTDASFNTETYTSSGIASETPTTYIDSPPAIGYSSGLVVELPPLDSTDLNQRLTLFPHGFGADGWPGCNIHVSTDGGNSYALFGSTTSEATWGKVAVITPPPTDVLVWDNVTTISVELKTGTLSSTTEINVLNGENWALVGEEVIGFKNAVLTSGTTYTLSGLLRGRRGTESFTSTHATDEGFMLLDSSMIEFPYELAVKETTFYFKFVTIGSDISKATAYEGKPSTKSRRPWAVAALDAVRIGNDWTISWLGRNQFDGEMVDSQAVSQPEMFGGFVIQILDGTTEKRSITQQTTNYKYTEAQQIADWGAVQTSLKISISQIDREVGPGANITTTF